MITTEYKIMQSEWHSQEFLWDINQRKSQLISRNIEIKLHFPTFLYRWNSIPHQLIFRDRITFKKPFLNSFSLTTRLNTIHFSRWTEQNTRKNNVGDISQTSNVLKCAFSKVQNWPWLKESIYVVLLCHENLNPTFSRRHHLQKSVVHQALGGLAAVVEETNGVLDHTDLKWRPATKSVCKSAPKYRAILSTATVSTLWDS